MTYDGWQRVTRWASYPSAGGGSVVTRDYTFDPLGNLFGGGGLIYDGTTNRLTKATGGFLTYDRAGNLTAKLGTPLTYGYDALERLVSVWRGGVLIARYGYDVAGRRIVKRVYDSSTGGTVGTLRMVYAGTQVAFETDSNNTSLSTIYTWGPGVDNLLGMKVGTTNYSVVTDALGSVRALVRRDDGAWVGRLRYDPYGQLIDSAGPQPALRYRWTGREYDAETGFYFHRTRYYDPAVGRFVQEDRAGYSGGGNLYAYVNGNVLQARDPEGLRMAWTDAGFGFEPICTLSGSALQFDGSVVSGACNQYPGSGGSGGAAALIAWAAGQEFNQLQRDIRNGTLIVSFTDADGRTQTVEIRLRDLGSSSSCSFCSLIPEGAAVFIGAALDAASPLGGFTFAVGSFLDSHGHGSYTRLGVAAGLDLSVGIEGGYASSFQKYSLSYQVGVGPVSGTVSASPLLGVSASIGASLFPLSFSGSYSYTTMKYRGFWAPAR